MLGTCARPFFAAIVAAVAFTSSLPAQDFFQQKKLEWAIEAQKVTADATAALDKSRQLEKTQAVEAKKLLEKNLLAVNDCAGLDDKERGELRSRLLTRLKQVDASVREQKAAAESANKASAAKAAREEQEKLDLLKLQGQQKSAYDLSKSVFDGSKKSLDAQRQIQLARDKGILSTRLDIDKTASKMSEERITDYFIAKSEKRKLQLSPEEKTLLKALNSTISVDFDKEKSTLKDVLEYLTQKTKAAGARLNIFPDEASLKERDVEYNTKVGISGQQITVRTVLKKVLGDLGLTYVIKEGNVHVITPDRAKDYLVVRSYPVQDLIAPFDLRWGPYANREQMLLQANQLIQMIVNSIEPTSWVGIGDRGYGTISYNEATMSLIVRHTAEMHYMLGGGLGR